MIAPDGTRRWPAITLALAAALVLAGTVLFETTPQAADDRSKSDSQPTEFGRPSDLPLPSGGSVAQFEEKLFEFLNARKYHHLGWLRDKGIRDTGSYLAGKYYGTHPAVRVYYSPGVIKWLLNGRVGKIPDGEMIVKEQFAAPAARHHGKTDDELWRSLESWTVMVKDSAGSHDGWFWSNPIKGQCVTDAHRYPFDYPVSGFGIYCVRCHTATQSPGAAPASDANEFTFVSLRNIAGFAGQPILFRVDDSWRKDAQKEKAEATNADVRHDSHPSCARPKPPELPMRRPNSAFLSFFDSIKVVALKDVAHLPPVTHDWVASQRDPSQEFVTSNQCMSCHSALAAPFGPSMFIPTGSNADYGAPGWDVSPHGEWRWTPMGLAGRDPLFFAQIESELRMIHKEFGTDSAEAQELASILVDTCLRCHGAMGKKQFHSDQPDPGARMNLEHIYAVAGPTEHVGRGAAKYGALARDGVGCAVCHRMQPRTQPPDDRRPYLQYFFETSITGNFQLGAKAEIYGPFKDNEIAPYAMEHATGIKPKHSDYLKSSQLCGACHTVALPSIDMPFGTPGKDHTPDEVTRAEVVPQFRKFHHQIEQATYLEWLNSEYENEVNPKNPSAKSCTDCHMSRGLKDEKHGIDIPQIRSRIAAIQDTTYPDAENLAAHEQLNVRPRDDGFRRHNFSGLNAFLLELFNQFDDVLGVPKTDFMTGSPQGIGHAVDHITRTARDDVATLDVSAQLTAPNQLTARVVVKNKVGHRFPSGVGFRRAFIELAVIQPPQVRGDAEKIIWASGRTNELGVMIGADGRPLATESFARDPESGEQRFQPHHTTITSPDQVQVYEILSRNAKGNFTTSFVRGCEIAKDNRLLPRGWKREGPGPALTGRFLKATFPDPVTGQDPRYTDGSGTDEIDYRIQLPPGVDPARLQVRTTLYYQAIPPYLLRNLFETAPDDPATRRLHYLCSHINLKGTAIEDWKLRITSATCDVAK
jgi:hypothetical protein